MTEEIKQEQTTEVVPQEVPKTPTMEEQYKALQTEFEKTKVELENTTKGLKTAHQTLTQKDKALKEQTDLRTELAAQAEWIKVLAGAISERGSDIDSLAPEKRQDYLKIAEERAAKVRQENETKQQAELAKQKTTEYNSQADAIYARAKTVITTKKDLKMVELLLKNGDAESAEELVADVEKEKKPVETPKVENKETEDARIARLVEEGIRKRLEDKGLLVSDDGKPAGGSATVQEAYELAAKGKISWEEAKKRGATFS